MFLTSDWNPTCKILRVNDRDPAAQIPDLERYLKSVLGSSVRIVAHSLLAKPGKEGVKGYGYGTPLLLEYQLNGKLEKAVLHTIREGPFGHEHMSDRAQSLLWDHGAFNTLPKHVRSLDVGAFNNDGSAVSLSSAEEFFTLTAYGEGTPYALDLARIRDTKDWSDQDQGRADVLCDYLSEIHAVKSTEPGLYVRRIRELLGHSECIMGLIDSYPEDDKIASPKRLAALEKQCVAWRWRIKQRTHRLCQVHGDFHPWNILFREGSEFCLLDRSRGEYGDAADDVTCLSMNYLFFSLQQSGRLAGHFEALFNRFWTRYLEQTRDKEILEVAAPFLVFRGLVMGNPVWYPQVSSNVRESLFSFMESVLTAPTFEPGSVNRYCRG
jgi:hypothetical protein